MFLGDNNFFVSWDFNVLNMWYDVLLILEVVYFFSDFLSVKGLGLKNYGK